MSEHKDEALPVESKIETANQKERDIAAHGRLSLALRRQFGSFTINSYMGEYSIQVIGTREIIGKGKNWEEAFEYAARKLPYVASPTPAFDWATNHPAVLALGELERQEEQARRASGPELLALEVTEKTAKVGAYTGLTEDQVKRFVGCLIAVGLEITETAELATLRASVARVGSAPVLDRHLQAAWSRWNESATETTDEPL